MPEVQLGETVKAHYRSGTYIGKVMDDKGDRYVVEVLAVKKHPMQGDLHNPNQTEGVFFHERKALAHHEKMNVKKPAVHSYPDPIPNYIVSLKEAVETYRAKLLKDDTAYHRAALECLNRLEEQYYDKI
ncbi:MAG: kinase-associated lipoprotein B [Bacillota bacterium]|uniref:Kinase-associated lipoprotein B n=1 Tax=Virgibacillus salarius TaxID=447199 RepID=A0A941DSG3_9BACI|nr:MULTISPECIES: kinase-associated lipoprotein B [Bacillaceae]NAZ07268.1 kinase [Agaribacter marinus]MBR7794546.1 kinase-associated lipoprotein B [Virgibacillus salarius]MCC2249465.1 kinase-associated lipoprotein B [Virgibacillus sp. AGTR]MDY7043337.1 kinase-associated lipoprotein B [Virgibacillus sp. M23]QRZ17832.1 kinase-associated lipoprotein B [Virgibacillus sp. AGTR]